MTYSREFLHAHPSEDYHTSPYFINVFIGGTLINITKFRSVVPITLSSVTNHENVSFSCQYIVNVKQFSKIALLRLEQISSPIFYLIFIFFWFIKDKPADYYFQWNFLSFNEFYIFYQF